MGMDAEIFFRSSVDDPAWQWWMPTGFIISRRDQDERSDELLEATHEVDCDCSRYYGVGYEHGCWPTLAGVLMKLLSSPDIDAVWYGSDTGPPKLFTVEDVLDLSRHYVLHGNRPYNQSLNQ